MDGGARKSRTWLSDFTFPFHFHALEKEMAPHSSTLAWRIPGTGEPGGLPSMGSHRVGHDGSDLAAAAAATTAANDLIFVELDGGLCSLFYRALFLVLFLLDFRVISWSMYPMVLETLILRSGKDFIDRLLNMLLLAQALLTVAKSPPILLVCHGPGSSSFLLFFPSLELHYYNYWSYRMIYLVNCFKSHSHYF